MNSIPAFPCNELYDKRGVVHRSPGMGLRDYFAAKAMQVDYQQIKDCSDPYWREYLAIDAYKMADAMLKARLE